MGKQFNPLPCLAIHGFQTQFVLISVPKLQRPGKRWKSPIATKRPPLQIQKRVRFSASTRGGCGISVA